MFGSGTGASPYDVPPATRPAGTNPYDLPTTGHPPAGTNPYDVPPTGHPPAGTSPYDLAPARTPFNSVAPPTGLAVPPTRPTLPPVELHHEWVRVNDGSGAVYFANHILQTTVGDLPTLPQFQVWCVAWGVWRVAWGCGAVWCMAWGCEV